MKKYFWLIVGGIVIAVGVVVLILCANSIDKKLNIGAYINAIQFLDAKTGTAKSVTFDAENLRVSAQPYLYSIAEGDVSGHSPFSKYGRVSAVGTTELDVIPWGGTYSFPTTAQRLVVSSTNADDASGGNGIKTITIEGLDGSYATTSETIALSGATQVTTTALFLRINRVYAATAGSWQKASGTIYIANVTSSQRLASIETGYTQSRQMIYTVPYNQTLYITSVRGSCGVGYIAGANTMKQTYNTFTTRANYTGSVTTSFFLPYNEFGTVNQMSIVPLEIPTKLIGTTDLKISVIGDVANSVACQAALRGWIE